jgi:two-component system, cell cycle sensor histidine kinase and response regulator CckA
VSQYSPFQPWSAGSPYSLALGLAALFCVLIAVVAFRRRALPGGFYLALMMAAAAWWALLYGFELTTPSIEGKVFWVKLEYMGAVAMPLAWLLFAWSYTGLARKLDRRVLVALCAMPVLTVLLTVTNGLHVLMWSTASLSPPGGFPAANLASGPWYWVNTAYCYGLVVAGSVLLLRMALRFPKLYRGQALLLLVAIVIPWIGNGLTVFVLVPHDSMDVTPFAFLFTGLVLLATMSRGRLFTRLPVLVPLARMQVLETMTDGILVADMEGRVVTANPAALAMFGREEREPVGATISELLGETAQRVQSSSDGGERRFEIGVGEGEDRRHFDVVSSPLSLRGGGVGSLLVLRDITERQRTEMALRSSEERFRAVFEQGSIGIALFDTDQRFIRVNPAFCAMLGRTEGELIGLSIDQITAPVDRDRTSRETALVFSGERSGMQMDKQYLRKDGTFLRGHVSAALLRGADGRPIGTVAVVQDVGERRRAEDSLKMSQAQLEYAMDLSDLVPWEFDVAQGIFTFNDRFYALYATTAEREGGYQMSADTYSRTFVHPDERHTVAEEVGKAVLSDDPEFRAYMEHRIVRSDGQIRHIAVRYGITKDEQGKTVKTHGANQDVTERIRTEQALLHAEEQLRQSQKMEAVGQLAGGIAHDFNNLLTAIIGNGELALEGMSLDDPNRVFVEDIKEVGERAAGLTRQILAFSRRQMLKPEVVDLNDVVRMMDPLLQRTIGEEIRIEARLAPDLRLAEVDPHQMEQVLMNLAVNARDAMPNGGRLTIETANVALDEGFCAGHTELEPGDCIVLSVSDTGHGMDEETRARVFEPFFTTKEMGKGTGLGLSTVFGIVRQSGGAISVESEPGKGSTFRVYLPACNAAATASVERSVRRAMIKGTEAILVVEDERPVRELVVRILKRAGYTTLEAGSAAEADTLMEERHPAIDLLLTDVVLPGGRGGRDIAMSVRSRHPGVPVVFMSGYTQDSAVFDGSVDANADFLEKPFSPDGLLGTVRGALDTRAAEGLQMCIHPSVR